MAKKKEFKVGLYAVLTGVILAVVLAGLTVYAYTTRYTAFSPEKVAAFYTDTIVQTGDGYNAYKNSLVSKNAKYGDFIRNAYMKPYVKEKDENGKDIPQAEFVGTGSKEEQEAIDKVYNTMYDYYCKLLKEHGWDDYDAIFSAYFPKLVEVRHEVYGDDFMNTDYMFGALEANVDTYGKNMTGVEAQKAEQGKAEVKEIIGEYQKQFGKNYRFTTRVKECTPLSENDAKLYIEQYKARITPIAESGEAKATLFGLEDTVTEKKVLFFTKKEEHKDKTAMIEAFKKLDCSADITAVDRVVCEVTLDDGTSVAEQELYVVKIGRSWYVDNTNINTKRLYLAK